ncbi:uncharacterized protein LOC113219609 [Piliocolobus tephrosceles]|uniref:uncharacterized protein LOC113219609 n=1 Tax=Piliocolobus tephrosceles TaxID=591936 RepID=UPI000E6B2028|nr:uncharacterized protein LOC113219609 [Piliocolobus tephrosceles]
MIDDPNSEVEQRRITQPLLPVTGYTAYTSGVFALVVTAQVPRPRSLSPGAASPSDACEGGLGSAADSTGATGPESAEHALFGETKANTSFQGNLGKGRRSHCLRRSLEDLQWPLCGRASVTLLRWFRSPSLASPKVLLPASEEGPRSARGVRVVGIPGRSTKSFKWDLPKPFLSARFRSRLANVLETGCY